MYRFQKRLLRLFLAISCNINVLVCAQEAHEHRVVKSKIDTEPNQLQPLMHKNKLFFPIGAYGRPRIAKGEGFVSFSALREQGWNTVIEGVPESSVEFKRLMEEADVENFAVIIHVGNAVKAQDRNEVIEKIAEAKNLAATLGYYIFDEPENVYSNSDEYKRIRLGGFSVGLQDLNKFITRKIGWVKPLIRQKDSNPEHYIFMCIAWWNHYRKLQPLCEINMPNEYPTRNTRSEFEGPQAVIVYDARLAANAAYEAGRKGFCYTPFAINIGLEKNYRYPTINEFRYSAFAPITQGAMGIIYWAGYRCKTPYAEQVVFPVTRELSELKPFFLGKWLDQKLSCEPSQRSNELLKKYDVPTVSGCLRQSGDNRYLMLAVNNTANTVQATFRLEIEKLPGEGRESISGRMVSIRNGVIKDEMRPYGVCAYIIEPAKIYLLK